MCSVALGMTSARRMFRSASSSSQASRVEIGDLHRRLALRLGGELDLVLAVDRVELVITHVADVGDVLHVADLVAEVLERPMQQVAKEIGPQVADVRVLVDGAPAGVDADAARLERHERLGASRERVVQADRREGGHRYRDSTDAAFRWRIGGPDYHGADAVARARRRVPADPRRGAALLPGVWAARRAARPRGGSSAAPGLRRRARHLAQPARRGRHAAG